MPSEAEIAWAAGLFEGEGCFCLHQGRERRMPNPMATMISTDLDVLERFQVVVGVGGISPRHPKSHKDHWKPQWMWQVNSFSGVQRVIALLEPWLSDRRTRKAAEVMITCLAAREEKVAA